jgi:hypothetical protein
MAIFETCPAPGIRGSNTRAGARNACPDERFDGEREIQHGIGARTPGDSLHLAASTHALHHDAAAAVAMPRTLSEDAPTDRHAACCHSAE